MQTRMRTAFAISVRTMSVSPPETASAAVKALVTASLAVTVPAEETAKATATETDTDTGRAGVKTEYRNGTAVITAVPFSVWQRVKTLSVLWGSYCMPFS